jgi:hypothetical protein
MNENYKITAVQNNYNFMVMLLFWNSIIDKKGRRGTSDWYIDSQLEGTVEELVTVVSHLYYGRLYTKLPWNWLFDWGTATENKWNGLHVNWHALWMYCEHFQIVNKPIKQHWLW